MRSLIRPWFVASIVLLAAVDSAAQAHEPTSGEIAVARTEFQSGVAAIREDRWEDARRAFERSYRLYPRPATLMNLAGAQVHTGHLVDGIENYRRFLREAGATTDVSQREAAQAALADAERRVPHVVLRVTGLRSDDSIDIDGTSISSAVAGSPYPIDPGEHTVRVMRGGVAQAHQTVRVAEGESRDVSLGIADAAAAVSSGTTSSASVGTSSSGTSTLATHDRGSDRFVRVDQPPPPRRSIVSSPWFWVASFAVAGAAAGLTLGLYYGLQTPTPPYSGNLGQVDVR